MVVVIAGVAAAGVVACVAYVAVVDVTYVADVVDVVYVTEFAVVVDVVYVVAVDGAGVEVVVAVETFDDDDAQPLAIHLLRYFA